MHADSPCKILVVDDEPDILDALSIILSDEGYAIITDNGKAVEKKVLEEHPNILLLDVLLSGENGGDIAKRLKSGANTKNLPIILMSAHPNAKKIAEESGANSFIPKPFDVNNIVALIKKYQQ